MFLQRSLYYISNEVLLISKKIENGRTQNTTLMGSNAPKQEYLKELLFLLNKNLILTSDSSEFSAEIGILHRYIKSVYEYCRQLTITDIMRSRSPRSACRKKSKQSLKSSNSKSYYRSIEKNKPKISVVKSRNDITIPKKKYSTDFDHSQRARKVMSYRKSLNRSTDSPRKKSGWQARNETAYKPLKCSSTNSSKKQIPRINCFITDFGSSDKGSWK